MTEKAILTCFIGNFNHETNTRLLKNTNKTFDEIDSNKAVRKKLYNVMVECLDNLCRHPGTDNTNSLFILSENNSKYQVITGNKIFNSDLEGLISKIEKINSMDRPALREWYNQIINKGEISEKGGAGVGLIDIVLKSGNKLEYEIKSLPDGYSFLILKAMVSSNSN